MPDQWLPGRPPGSQGPNDPIAELQKLWGQIVGGRGGGNGQSPPGPGFSLSPSLLAAILAAVWLLSGIFIVAPDERGIVLRFGRVVREAGPGPGYHLPWPIEEVMKPSVTAIRKEEFGFRTVSVGPPARYVDEDSEALMVTGDENIVKLQFIVQYRIKPDASGPSDFLFKVHDGQRTVRDAAEAAMREVIGRSDIDDALTEGKDRIQTEAQVLMQQIVDRYSLGAEIMTVKLQDVDPPDQVADAFKDVISAQQDRERMINEATGYSNDVVPKARGQAAQMLNEADAYAQTKVRDAEGSAGRFSALQAEYAKASDVTRTRLYLETMEQVVGRSNLIVLDANSAKQVVPYLPLDQMLKAPKPAAAEPAAKP